MTYNVHFKLIPPTYESQMWAAFRCQTWIIVQWLDLFWIQMDSWVWQTYESYACGSLKDREVCVTKQSNNSCFIQLLVELKDEACCHFWVHIKQETTFKCLILNIIQPKSVKKGVKRKKKSYKCPFIVLFLLFVKMVCLYCQKALVTFTHWWRKTANSHLDEAAALCFLVFFL